MDKPTKPTDLVPRSFGGVKNNFSLSLQASGYEDGVPAIYGGDNLNYQLDATGKELDYCEKICDFINALPIGKTITVDENNKLTYANNIDLSSRNIGEIVSSTIPLIDAGLHLLNGSLLPYGSYKAFIDYIADLYNSGNYTAIFDTEANWQSTVAQYGVCSKFVYDSVANTVRLPKWGSQVFTKGSVLSSTVPVVGTGKSLGLTNGTTNYGLSQTGASLTADSCTASVATNNFNKTVGYLGSTSSSSSSNNKYAVGVVTDGSKSGIIANLSSALTNYPLDCYYYIVIATTTKTDIEVDIDEIATDLNGKMDTDGTNAVSSVKFADGQWVNVNVQLVDNVTYPTTEDLTYDLSNILPNDNNNYEILLVGAVITGSTSGDDVTLGVQSDILNGHYSSCICGARTRTNSTVYGYGTVILPISTSRNLYVRHSSTYEGIFTLRVVGYRRIGTNN